MTGRQIGRYLFEEKLGEGGMAEVWKARNVMLGTPCAIKFLSSNLALNPDVEQRFLSEGRRQATLNHPNIVAAQDFLYVDNRSYLVMRYVDGEGLDNYLFKLQAPMAVPAALAVSRDVLDALEYAHSEGVIHRDIKPSNILLENSGRAYLLDFGIALALGEQRLTRAGVAIGTPHYMSPEQIMGSRNIDRRADIYSYGCVLYQMLAERPPFDSPEGEGDTEYLVKDQHLRQKPVPLRDINPEIPANIDQAVMRCLEKDPEDRFASCRTLLEAITADSVLRTPPPISPGKSPVTFEAVAGALPPRVPVAAMPVVPAPSAPPVSAMPASAYQPPAAAKVVYAAPQKKSAAVIWTFVGSLVAALLVGGVYFLYQQAKPKPKPVQQAAVIPGQETPPAVETPPAIPQPKTPQPSQQGEPDSSRKKAVLPKQTPQPQPDPRASDPQPFPKVAPQQTQQPEVNPQPNPPQDPSPDGPPHDPDLDVVAHKKGPPKLAPELPLQPPPPPSYSGPSSGNLVWSGSVEKNQIIEINNGNSSLGSVGGDPLPGVPVSISLNSNKFAVIAQPNPLNRFSRLAVRSSVKGQLVLTIHWSVLGQ